MSFVTCASDVAMWSRVFETHWSPSSFLTSSQTLPMTNVPPSHLKTSATDARSRTSKDSSVKNRLRHHRRLSRKDDRHRSKPRQFSLPSCLMPVQREVQPFLRVPHKSL